MTWPTLSASALLVDVVHDQGVMGAWNARNYGTGSTLDPGDLIRSVNDQEGMDAMKRELALQTSISMTVLKFPEVARKKLADLAANPTIEFKFPITRKSPTDRLGIDTSEADPGTPDGLIVTKIVDDLLVDLPNQSIPKGTVTPDSLTPLEINDKIISVNGKTNIAEMKQELSQSLNLSLKVQRSVRPSGTNVVMRAAPGGNITVAGMAGVDPSVPIKIGPPTNMNIGMGKGGPLLSSPRPPFHEGKGSHSRNFEIDIKRNAGEHLGLEARVDMPDKISSTSSGTVRVDGIVEGSVIHRWNLAHPWEHLMVGDEIKMVNGISNMQSTSRMLDEFKSTKTTFRMLIQRAPRVAPYAGEAVPLLKPKEVPDSARGIPPPEKPGAKKAVEKERMNKPAVTAKLLLKSLELSDSELSDVFATILQERPWLKETMMQSLEAVDRGVV